MDANELTVMTAEMAECISLVHRPDVEMVTRWHKQIAALAQQVPQPVVDAPFDPADDTPTKPGQWSEPGAEHVHKRGEAECPTCGTHCRTEYVLWSSQFLGTQSRTDYIPASQPQQGAVEAATHMGYASVMDALDDLADYRKETIGQQAVDDERNAFESAFTTGHQETDLLNFQRSGGHYNQDRIEALWEGWSKRAALTAALAAHGKGG